MIKPINRPRQFLGGILILIGCALFGLSWWVGTIVLIIGVVVIDLSK